ncbi:MAG TPA: hypothetical protein VJ785_11700 [Anaerolineales bacterium]|nr:hypothetical protein [Anaerolineales bacterium]
MATSRKNNSRSKNGRSTRSRSSRRSPGSSGKGEYYHVEIRPGEDFETFRTQDVGSPGHIQRVAGKREGGSWATVKWLIGKQDAHVSGDTLVGDTKDAKDVLRKLRSKPVHISGDRFKSKPRKNVTEESKPTSAQKKARSQNIRKAQAARSKSR